LGSLATSNRITCGTAIEMYSYLLTGIIAGIASSVLYISGTLGTPVSIFLYFLAPLPLFITGLGWGAISAAVGAVAGVIVCIFFSGLTGGGVYFLSIGLIPIVLSHYTLMSRSLDGGDQPGQNTSQLRDWYPLGNLIIWIAGFAALLSALIILFVMPSTPELKVSLETLFGALLEQNAELKARLGGEGAVQQMVGMFIALLPVTLSAYTFVTTTVNFWLASKIISASGRAIRPDFEMSALTYPRILPLVLVATLVLTFLPGIIHIIALAGTASLTIAFMLLGMVVIHAIIPNVPARIVFLGALYVTIFILLKFAYLGLALLGIAETIFGIRHRFSSSSPPSNPGPKPPTTRDN